jgi:hypothetical protein
MAQNNWKFQNSQFSTIPGYSHLAEILETVRKEAPLHTGEVSNFSIERSSDTTIVSCDWQLKNYNLSIEVVFKGHWRRDMPTMLTNYFFYGTFNGIEGFGKIQGYEIIELVIVLAGPTEELLENLFAPFVYHLEETAYYVEVKE